MSRLSFDILIAWMDRDKVKGQAVFFLTTKLWFFSFLLIFINTHLTFSGECFHLEHHRWTRTNMVFIFSPQFSELSIYTHIHTHTISNWQLKVQTGTEKLSRKSKTNVPGGGPRSISAFKENLKYSCFCPICITPNIHNMMQRLQLRVATQV